MTRTIAAIGILIAGLLPAFAAGAAPGESGLTLNVGGQALDAPLLETDVDINVSGIIARTSVRQTFTNDSPEWAEAVYRFPLPDGAAVDRLRIHVGERVIEGEIQEKLKAEKTYAVAKSKGQKTSLVQQSRANLFTTRLANIAPGEVIRIEIEYQEEVRWSDGLFSLRFPMTMTERYVPTRGLAALDSGPVYSPMVMAARERKLSLDIYLDTGLLLDQVASRYHAISVDERSGKYHVSLAAGDVSPDRDFELSWRPAASSSPRALSFSEMRDGEAYYLLMLMPPNADVAPLRLPRETIFVIDTSGSMHGDSIRQARRALLRALDRLQPGDLFNVVEFNSVTRPLFNQSAPADGQRLRQAEHFIRGLSANGGTEMSPALHFALSSPVSDTHLRQVVFITDGSVGNEEALYEQIERTRGQARLFTVGIGSAPNSWFMRKAAEVGHGTFTVISSISEVEARMDGMLEKIESPQLTDIRVDWPGSAKAELYPAVVPDLYAGEPLVLRARARDFTSGTVRLSGRLPSGNWHEEVPLDSAFDDFGVGALWARARIEDLYDQQRRGANPDNIRAAVVETALTHRLVSRVTSLVAVDKTPARAPGTPMKTGFVPNLLPAGQTAAFPATATNAALYRMIAAAIFALAVLLFLSERRRVAAA